MLTKVETPEESYRRLNPEKIRIWDPKLDQFRDATQDDLDRAMTAALHGAEVREHAVRLHDKWLRKFNGQTVYPVLPRAVV